VVLGHANTDDAINSYPYVVELIKQRNLQAVTVGNLFA
jgi:hypothetical protein